jgi:uncharacterized protein (TIRG00374 family)
MNWKLLSKIGINTGIGVVLITVWLKLVNIGEIINTLETINLIIIFPCLILLVLLTVFRSLRLKIFLSQFDVSFKDLLNLNFLSQLLSFLIPIRAGEITKSVYLTTQYKMPITRALIIIFVDRFFDFWLIVFCSLILLILIPNNLPSGLIFGLTISLIIFSAGTLLLIAIPNQLKQLLLSFRNYLVFSFVKKIYTQIAEFITDIGVLLNSRKTNLVTIISLSLMAIISEAAVWYILFTSLFTSVDPFSVWLGSMLNSLTFLIPAAPGYVGSAEAAGLAVFNLGLGFEKTGVAAATLLYHAFVLIFMLIFGLLGLYFLKFDLRKVWTKLTNRD